MKRLLILAAIAASYSCHLSAAVDESIEPPLPYVLNVGGVAHVIQLGKAIQIPGTLNNPSVTLEAQTTRHFSYGGVGFDYPAQYGWEASITSEPRSWILSGNSFKIMLFVAKTELPARAFADSMAQQFKSPSSAISPISRKFGYTELKGFRLKATVVNSHFNIDVLAVPTQFGGSVLVLQDSLPESGDPSKEAEVVIELLKTSFRVKQ